MLVHLFACLKMSSLPPKRLKRESHFSAASKALDLVTLSLGGTVLGCSAVGEREKEESALLKRAVLMKPLLPTGAAERRPEGRDEGLHLVDRALVEAQRVHGRDEVLDALGDARRVDRVALLQVRRRRAHAQQPVARARAVDAPLREERLGARDRAVARQRGLARAELGHELAARRLVVGRGHGAPRVRLLHGLAGLEQGIKVRQVRLAPPLPRARVEGGVGHQVG